MHQKKKTVVMEPDLEEMAGDLGGTARLELARLYGRYKRQLEVTGKILMKRADQVESRMKRLRGERLKKN